MAFIALVETPDDNRGRFIAPDCDTALAELSRRFPIGATVAEKLRRGDVVTTESYRIQLIPLQSSPPKRQQRLFD